MKKLMPLCFSLILLGTLGSQVRADMSKSEAMPGAKPGRVWTEARSVKATVTNVNSATREVTIKGPKGEVETIKCGEEVKNFAQIKKGDVVVMDYLESVALFVRGAKDAAPAAGDSAGVEVAAHGEKPSAKIVGTSESVATVMKVDKKTREVTLKNEQGELKVVKVGPEVQRFDQIKTGDQVVARLTQAVAIAVHTPK